MTTEIMAGQVGTAIDLVCFKALLKALKISKLQAA